MYSPLYFYFYLRPNKDLSDKISINKVREHLDGLTEIKQKNSIEYKNANSFPWINISLIHTDNYDSWSTNDNIDYVNLLVIEGSKRITQESDTIKVRYQEYFELLKRIADYLKWEITEDETEDGIENALIYKPD